MLQNSTYFRVTVGENIDYTFSSVKITDKMRFIVIYRTEYHIISLQTVCVDLVADIEQYDPTIISINVHYEITLCRRSVRF